MIHEIFLLVVAASAATFLWYAYDAIFEYGSWNKNYFFISCALSACFGIEYVLHFLK